VRRSKKCTGKSETKIRDVNKIKNRACKVKPRACLTLRVELFTFSIEAHFITAMAEMKIA